MIYLGIHIKKVIRNPERLDFSKPSIIIANHSSFLDILLMIMLNPKVIIMVKKWVYNSPVFGPFIRYSGYIFIEEGTEYNLDLIQQRVDDGYSIVVFPEGTRSYDGEIKRFHKGAFYLAKELNLDIQPIIIFGAHYVNPKNDFIIKSGSLILVVMDRIKCSDSLFEQRFGLMTKEMAKMMREELITISKREQTPDYLKKRVFYNYLYKSPILEWYVKIKWRMEGANFAFYDSLIGSRAKVYDIGCGLGYLGYYLHYRDAQRKIIGIDYDDEKIAVAQNGYDKTDQLLFRHGDIRNLEIENADVVLYNDVLHYMSLEQQLQVLEKTVSKLNDDGMILIRDGITDLADRHSITKSTEKYSTKIIKFNKTTDELSFFSSKDIFNFAKAQNLEFEMVEQSKRTSNVLFILRKLRDGESAG
jgi:1-acyl-sn-glycerol-3-phosphate acyltransferase